MDELRKPGSLRLALCVLRVSDLFPNYLHVFALHITLIIV